MSNPPEPDQTAGPYSSFYPHPVAITGDAKSSGNVFSALPKVVAKIDDGNNITSKEMLIVSNGTDVSIVEYGTVSVGTEISQTWTASSASGTCTISCDSTGEMKGSFELIK